MFLETFFARTEQYWILKTTLLNLIKNYLIVSTLMLVDAKLTLNTSFSKELKTMLKA